MTIFTYHTSESAPEKSRPALMSAEKRFGNIPNVSRILAEAPITLAAYDQAFSTFMQQSSFTPAEQQVVFMTANFENNCHYCVPGHTWMMNSIKMPEEVIESLREGSPLPDERLEALRVFTRLLIDNRGHVGSGALSTFLNAGFTKQQALEILTGLASKLISNYANALANTEVDKAFSKFSWIHPKDR